jgi:transposase
MGVPKYTDEFRTEAVDQVTEKGRSVVEVAKNLGISDVTLYAWIKKSGKTMGALKQAQTLEAIEKENVRLRSENKRLQEERDILKKAAAYFAKESR